MSLPLSFAPALSSPSLLAPPVYAALSEWPFADEVRVAAIDPALSDTAAFCERYGVAPDESANCVVVAGRRDGEIRMAACMILATTRADVNGLVRRELDVGPRPLGALQSAPALRDEEPRLPARQEVGRDRRALVGTGERGDHEGARS